MASLTASSLAVTAKFSTEDQEMAEDSVAIDILMIQELIKTTSFWYGRTEEWGQWAQQTNYTAWTISEAHYAKI